MAKAEGSMRDLARAKGSRGVLIPELQAVALKMSGPDPTRRTDILHPSEMAKADWCWRASYFRITTGKLPPPEKFSFQMQAIFLEGNWAHEKWQHWMRQTGKLWGEWGCLLCGEKITGFVPELTGCRNPHGHMWKYLEVSLAHGIVAGHEDGAMADPTSPVLDGFMVEVKTVGLGSVRIDAPEVLSRYYAETVDGGKLYDLDKFFKELSHPLQSHVRQGNVYLWLAREMGLPFKTVRFLYEFKPTQAVKEFSIPYSDRIMEPILTGINAVQYALANGVPPECPHGGCKQCSAYHELLGMEDAGKTRSGTTSGTGNRAGVTRRAAGAGAERPVPGGGVIRRRGHIEGQGDRSGPLGEASGEGAPRGPSRRDRGSRPGADAGVHQPVEVDKVPDGTGGSRPGRRVLRRKTGN
jgi:hypothetical protein